VFVTDQNMESLTKYGLVIAKRNQREIEALH